jgi:hypothetical protein
VDSRKRGRTIGSARYMAATWRQSRVSRVAATVAALATGLVSLRGYRLLCLPAFAFDKLSRKRMLTVKARREIKKM